MYYAYRFCTIVKSKSPSSDHLKSGDRLYLVWSSKKNCHIKCSLNRHRAQGLLYYRQPTDGSCPYLSEPYGHMGPNCTLRQQAPLFIWPLQMWKKFWKGLSHYILARNSRRCCFKPHDTRREWQNLGGWQGGHLRKPSHRPVETEQQQVLSVSTSSNQTLPDNLPYN